MTEKTATEIERRAFTPARKAQGFKSQAHLDAFYRYYDHTQTCPNCNKPGAPYLTTDGGEMTTLTRCAEAHRLDAASFAHSEGRA